MGGGARTSGDEVGDAAALEEGVVVDAIVEGLAELDHLLQANADDWRGRTQHGAAKDERNSFREGGLANSVDGRGGAR